MLPTPSSPLPTPPTSRSSTPLSSKSTSLKKSVRINEPQRKAMNEIEAGIIDLDALEPLETAIYEIDVERDDLIRSVNYCLICADDDTPIDTSLKSVSIGTFSINVTNPTTSTRNLKVSYTVTF